MSLRPETNDLSDFEALALDYALGAGNRAERKAAEVRLASDPELRTAVERWQAVLAPLAADVADAAPPPAVWAAIAAEIDPPRRVLPAAAGGWWHNLGFWRLLAAGGPVLAALLVVLVVRPGGTDAPAQIAAMAPGPALVATLAGADGKPLIAAAYDPSSGEVRFAPVAANDAAGGGAATGKVPQLWVIEGKKPPRSLGVIDIAARASHVIPRAQLAGLKPGAVLAISIEPTGGSPTGQPTGPVIATGALSAA